MARKLLSGAIDRRREPIMGWRFRRSVKLLPGIRLNFNRSGITTTIGPRGAHVTVGGKRTRVTTGIPGTGISYSTLLPQNNMKGRRPAASSGSGVFALLLLFAMVGFCSRQQSTSPTGNKSATTSAPQTPLQPQAPHLVEASSPFFVAVDALNTRDAPNGRVLGKVTRGEKVPVFETADGWARISPTGEPAQWVSFARLCSEVGCFEHAAPKVASGAASTVAADHATATPTRVKPVPVYSSSCPCSGSRYCVGPRGGVYCITSGGNKRYASRR